MAKVDKTIHMIADTTIKDLYTVPASTKSRIASIVVGNVNSATKYFTLYHLPSGQAVADTYVIGGKLKKLEGTLGDYGAGEYVYEVPFPMAVGDKLTIVSETANTMVVKATVIEEGI